MLFLLYFNNLKKNAMTNVCFASAIEPKSFEKYGKGERS